jgi:hypothetical protein
MLVLRFQNNLESHQLLYTEFKCFQVVTKSVYIKKEGNLSDKVNNQDHLNLLTPHLIVAHYQAIN